MMMTMEMWRCSECNQSLAERWNVPAPGATPPPSGERVNISIITISMVTLIMIGMIIVIRISMVIVIRISMVIVIRISMMTIMNRIRMMSIQRRRIPWMRSKALASLQSAHMQIAGVVIILFSTVGSFALKCRGVPWYYTVFPLQPLAISHLCFNFSSFALFMVGKNVRI